MNRKIITFGGYFENFLASQSESTVRKIDYALELLRTQKRISSKFVKYIQDEIFELRIAWEGDIYRIFFIFDNGDIVVLFNGFQKKSQKLPKNEIEKALKIKKEYYDYKREQNK